jgi:4-amino-4-deoxy-L-arabinose transferase-like glycosyltransferase
MKNLKISSLLFATIALYCFLVLVRSIGIDMFFDGLIYSSIARNMASGLGDFWHPYYSQYFLNPFYEHPPLAMWLQSLGFRLFGDLWQLEFYWGFALGLITIIFIKKIWDELNPEGLKIDSSWLPILLFISIPSVTWTFSNNLLENTLIVFTTISAFCAIRALNHKLGTKVFMWSLLSGVFSLLGFLTKGFPALFVFALPFFYLVIIDRKSFLKVLSSTLVIFLSFGFFLSLLNLASHGEFYTFFNRYINDQVLKSIAGQNENIRYFYLVHRFIGEIIVPVAIALVLWYFMREKSKTKIVPKNIDDRKKFWFFICIAISASLPMFFVPKQRAWYLFPSFVFYALAIAQIIKIRTIKINTIVLNKRSFKVLISLLGILLLGAGILSATKFAGTKFKRNSYFYSDLLSNKNINFDFNSTIYTCPHELSKEWEMVAFMQRYFAVNVLELSEYKNLSNKSSEKKPLLILTDTDVIAYKDCVIPKNCRLINAEKGTSKTAKEKRGDLRYELYDCN